MCRMKWNVIVANSCGWLLRILHTIYTPVVLPTGSHKSISGLTCNIARTTRSNFWCEDIGKLISRYHPEQRMNFICPHVLYMNGFMNELPPTNNCLGILASYTGRDSFCTLLYFFNPSSITTTLFWSFPIFACKKTQPFNYFEKCI